MAIFAERAPSTQVFKLQGTQALVGDKDNKANTYFLYAVYLTTSHSSMEEVETFLSPYGASFPCIDVHNFTNTLDVHKFFFFFLYIS